MSAPSTTFTSGLWLRGLVRRRPLELLVPAVGLAMAIAFVVSLGAFTTRSTHDLTVRAAASVPVDWQVQLTPQGKPAAVARAVRRLHGVTKVLPVTYGKVDGFTSTGTDGVRETGAGYIVGLPPAYASTFPSEIRQLLGTWRGRHGVQLLQQTAANLAAGPGSRVTVNLGAAHRVVHVDGVVDMPAEDSFFQVVGLPPGAGATAPPDNVLLVPPATASRLFPGSAPVQQLHVRFRHKPLPSQPQDAALLMAHRANHLQLAVAGGALVGDNLGTALTAASEDARYADLLFLLLGLPGLALAASVAAVLVGMRADRRRRDTALLRLRGARTPAVLRLLTVEAAATTIAASLLGVPGAWLATRLALPGATPLPVGWCIGAVLGAAALAMATHLPALRTPAGIGRPVPATVDGVVVAQRNPWPLRAGLDVVLLAGAGVAFGLTARHGYQVVLAPEGVPTTQVDYAALAGPVLAWPGLALLVWRVTALLAGRRATAVSRALRRRPPSRTTRRAREAAAPELEAAAVRRRRQLVARGAAGLAVAVALVTSTAVFTATYRAQARVDVALTVGSDVAVAEPPGSNVGTALAAHLATAPAVRAVEPMQHRFAYVGPDLQDIYGIRPERFAAATPLQDAYVPGSSITSVLDSLRRTPDGVLLSAETLHDYQLHPGDLIRIRLQTGPDRAYRPVTFHVLGLVSEWPTAPRDSFIVANAAYLSKATGSDAVGYFLVRTDQPATTAAALRHRLAGTAARVNDIISSRAQVGSATGLAATDLSGLYRLELGFGVLLALASSALAVFAGILGRRRALVLLAALGATARQRGRFLRAEARTVLSGGLAGGIAAGTVLAYLLVKVLNGIFDPPPAAPTIPWTLLCGLVAAVTAATGAVLRVGGRLVARAGPSDLRDL